MSKDYIAIARAYEDAVLCGEQPACKWVRLACERNRRDRERSEAGDPTFPYVLDATAGNAICRFGELMPYVSGKGFAEVIGEDDEGRLVFKTLELQPWQVWIFTTLFGWKRSDGLRRFRMALILVPRKNGKALALDTRIPSPDGWTTMGAIRVNDRVFGPDGEPVRVVAVTDPMIGRECFRVAFSDGSVIVADGDHLWRAHDRWRAREVVERTSVMAARVNVGGRSRREHRYRIGLASPLQMPDRKFIVDPYVLGAWLGDGHTATARITTADQEVVGAITATGEYARPVTSNSGKAQTFALNDGTRRDAQSLQMRLRTLGVLGNKHIPEAYLTGSEAQRWALLQGLMDTDGNVAYSGRLRVPRCSFTSIKRGLAEGVRRLASSLGLKATLRERRATLNGRDCGPAFDVAFTAYADSPVFRLARKAVRLLPRPSAHRRSMARTIVAIDPVPSVPVRCIQVEREDGMYLAGDSCIQTHNSTLGAIMSLFMLTAEGEPGAQCYSAATTRDQAKAVAEVVWEMAKRSPALREFYGVRLGSPTTRSLSVPDTASKFMPLSADANSLDGLNVSFAVIDELHAHKTPAVFRVIDTATSARVQPLIVSITTAGVDLGGICYQQLGYLEKVLEGVAEDDTYFGLNFTIDVGDDYRDPAVARKANPNYGISVMADDIARKVQMSSHTSAQVNDVLTKHFNVWVRAESTWMPMREWIALGNKTLKIEDFIGVPCWIGVDLAEIRDIAALVAIFRPDRDHYVWFGRYYLPARAVAASPVAQMSGWVRDGFIIETEGDQADFQRIEDDIIVWCDLLDVREIDFDRALAAQMSQNLKRRLQPRMGKDAVEQFVITVPQTIETMNPAMQLMESLTLSGKISHDGNLSNNWMFSNVVVERNYKDEVYPRKAGGKDSPNKIDGPVAGLTAISRASQAAIGPRAKRKAARIWTPDGFKPIIDPAPPSGGSDAAHT